MADKVVSFSKSFWAGVVPEAYADKLILISTISDGSCYFHAIASAYSVAYLTEMLDGKPISKRNFVRNMRNELAETLKSYYPNLAKGSISSFGKEVPEASYEGMKELLLSTRAVGLEIHEFVSEVLEKDIYILDKSHRKLYPLGDVAQEYYKGRNSIILMYTPGSSRINGSDGHFELIGLRDGESVMTLFPSNHPLILHLRSSFNN